GRELVPITGLPTAIQANASTLQRYEQFRDFGLATTMRERPSRYPRQFVNFRDNRAPSDALPFQYACYAAIPGYSFLGIDTGDSRTPDDCLELRGCVVVGSNRGHKER